MKTKYTPGPWYTRHGQISSETSSHGCTIANCNRTSNGISNAEVEANARLIAAAPELLEACKALLDSENTTLGDGGSVLGDDYRLILNQAIAKATGGAQ